MWNNILHMHRKVFTSLSRKRSLLNDYWKYKQIGPHQHTGLGYQIYTMYLAFESWIFFLEKKIFRTHFISLKITDGLLLYEFIKHKDLLLILNVYFYDSWAKTNRIQHGIINLMNVLIAFIDNTILY